MWRRGRRPRRGDRRATALDASGLVHTTAQWRVLLTSDPSRVWALEQHDGSLWRLQGVSDTPAGVVRWVMHQTPTPLP